MAPQSAGPVDIFYSYAHEDEALRNKLEKHLTQLERDGIIKDWHDREILPGAEWDGQINEHLNSADIILLLVSSDFLASDYCNNFEVKRAMERHEAGEARVIPIILRSCDWTSALFGKLQVLPKDALPVKKWKDQDDAFLDVAKGIRKVAQELQPKRSRAPLPASIPRPPVVGFVARRDTQGRDILERLKEELAPHKNQVVALWGPGGAGKTTLAAEAARALSDLFPRRIVWVSPLLRADLTLSTLLDEIAAQLGHTDLRKLAPEEKLEQVSALIAAAPPLIVLDNFETITPEEQTKCVNFLAQRASCPALITTRTRIDDASNITLAAMSLEEAREFLKRLVEQTRQPSKFNKLDTDDLIKKCEANPLVLQWAVKQIHLAMPTQAVLKYLAQGEGDAAERVFDRSFNLPQVGDDGRAALLALSLFVPSASHEALAKVAGFDEDLGRLYQAIENLSALWLVDTTGEGERLFIQGLTRELAKAHLMEDAHAQEYRGRFLAFFLNYAEAHAKPTPEDFDALEAEKDNILSAMDGAFILNNWTGVIRLTVAINFGNTLGFLTVRGYWDEAIRRGKQALEAARSFSAENQISRFTHNLAVVYQLRGELAEAGRLYNESLEIEKRLGNQSGIASTLHGLGQLAHDRGEIAEARKLYNESLEIEKRLGNQSGMANTLHNLAVMAHAQGEIEEARRLYNESLEISKRLGNQTIIASIVYNLAVIAHDQGETAEARKLYNESLEIEKRLGNQSGIARTLHGLGRFAHDRGETAEARRLYNESLKIKKRLGDQSGIADTLNNLAVLAQNQGETAEARRLHHESLEISKRLGNQSGIANALHGLAVIAQAQGEIEEARKLYNESLEIEKRLGDPGGIATTLHNLALIAQAQGEIAEARRLYNESLEIKKRLGDQGGIASTLYQLGGLAQDQGETAEARRLYNESLEIEKRLGNQSSIGNTLHELGRLAQTQGEIAEAGRLYNESLEINRRFGKESTIASTLNNLAVIAQAQGKMEEARGLYNESLEIKKRLGDQGGIASTLYQLGRLVYAQGKVEEARRLYHESLEIKKRLGNQSDIAIALHALGALAASQGELKEARRLYNESLEITKKLDNKSNFALLLSSLGLLEKKENNKAEAARLFREALDIFEKLKSPHAERTRRRLKSVEDESQ